MQDKKRYLSDIVGLLFIATAAVLILIYFYEVLISG